MSTEPRRDDAAIELRGVQKHYGPVHAVDGVDLSIGRGEVFGLIGHNGAGKSTLFKMMLGLVPASAGEIRVAGADVRGSAFRAARRRIGYLPENVVLWDNLSGAETLRFLARLKGADATECAPLLERVGLADAAPRPVREYSKGMRQRLGFAQALLGRPQVLFLDEPTTGLDPRAIREFYVTLRELRDAGVTMVLSSHILAELQARVDRLAILSAGRVQALGSVQALREQRDLPLQVRVRAAPDDRGTVRAALGRFAASHGLPAQAPDDPAVADVCFACPRAAKMRLLQAMAALGSIVRDLTFVEPTLEDLFFGVEPTAAHHASEAA
jgi:Cu-processing system ATP-binding protein